MRATDSIRSSIRPPGATHLRTQHGPPNEAPVHQISPVRRFIFSSLDLFPRHVEHCALRDFNNVSADIADVWLPNTRCSAISTTIRRFPRRRGNHLFRRTRPKATDRTEMIEPIAPFRRPGGYERIPRRREQALYTHSRALERLSGHRQPDAGLSRSGRKARRSRPT